MWVLVFAFLVHSGLGLKPSNECNSALGLEDLRIQDSQLTALSHYESLSIGGGISVDTEPKCARLNKNNCAWCAPSGNGQQYLQVDLHHDFIITGIATQGFEALSNYYVRKYKVSHSRNGHTWSILSKGMSGNRDGRSVVRHTFSSPMYARYIRVYPVAYRYRICMRMELYGCSNVSSSLSTKPSPTSLSGTNNTIPENLPITGTTAASSTEKLMTIHSTKASSVLSTAPPSTTLSVTNNTAPKNVPPTTRTTAASSTEKPLISHSTTCNKYDYRNISIFSDQTVQSGNVLVTTPRAKEYHPSERHTGKVAVHRARDDSKRHSSKTWVIVLGVVAIAVVIAIIISLLVRFSFLQRRKLFSCYRYPSNEIDVYLL
ncbi:discoidin, CUB and LCCL domain-containing protein 2-like isoform X2 [Acropora muricata]|uniref:discoidin, CUB and LCCL domain-containing protein 2-like isoform X2 n=1 Tax=Acropora muricata TaxID=159855 RepID=UPI0034E5177B